MNLDEWQNSDYVRQCTNDAIKNAWDGVSEAIGCMMAEGRSLDFTGIEHLANALNHITQAEKELHEMRALEDGE